MIAEIEYTFGEITMETQVTSNAPGRDISKKTYALNKKSDGLPAPRVIHGNTLSGIQNMASFSKTAMGDTTSQPSFWYSPELTTDSYLLPKTRAETLRFCQIYYNLDPYIHSILNMHAQYGFSKFYLQYKDPDITTLFNKLLFYNQDFDWYQFTLDVALSYWKYGEACLSGDTQIYLHKEDSKIETVTLKELYDKQQKSFKVISLGKPYDTWVYMQGVADEVWLTRKQASVVKVTLSNGSSVRCTPDHLFMLRDTTYLRADCLKHGTELAGVTFLGTSDITVVSVEDAGVEDVYDIHSVADWHNFAIAPGIIVHNCVWGSWNSARRTWDRFTLINPAIVEYKEDLMTGHATMELIPTNEMKRIVKDALLQGRRDIDPLLLNAIENNKKLPLDTEGIPENVFTGQDYVPPKVFMFQRRTDPSSERGTSAIVCLMKDLIYKDQLRMSQIAVAQKTQLPIELWTVGHIGNDEQSSMLPGPELLEEVRQMITQATQQPPFSIVYGPYLKYEALGVTGKLLDIYNDLGYVENQILVGLGVNKAVVLGEGPSVQGKAISLNRLVREYTVVRDLFSNWFKRNILLPISKANHLVDEEGQYILPNLVWELSLQPEQDKETFDMFYKMWKDGLISTMTLFEKCPKQIDYTLEMQRLSEEVGSPFDKGDKRLGKNTSADAGGSAKGGDSELDTAKSKGVEAGKGNPELRDFALGGGADDALGDLETDIPAEGEAGGAEEAPEPMEGE